MSMYRKSLSGTSFLLVLLMLPLLVGCEKTPGSGQGGVYIDGKLEHRLKCAYLYSNTSYPPNEYRTFCFHDKMYSEDPRYKVKEIVCIEDKYYRDRTYESIGGRIDRIQINTLQAIADLVIPMNQGKYEGGNELVSSVQINKYSYPKWGSGKLLEKAQIDIDILLIDGRTINIRFTGTTAFGGSEWE